MEILALIWNNYLYVPLFNLLIYIYLNFANYNLGLAVIILTIFLRVLLIPFTYFVERGKVVGDDLQRQVSQIMRDYANDPVKRKHAVRDALRASHIHPWAKAVVVGAQLLVLVLLYQVFVDGISGSKFHLLYSGIPRPDFIDTQFLWFDISQRSYILAAVVAFYLFFEIMLSNLRRQDKATQQDQMYTIFFPAGTFLVLVLLPSVKSIFILTSLVFSTIISLVTLGIKSNLTKIKETKRAQEIEEEIQEDEEIIQG